MTVPAIGGGHGFPHDIRQLGGGHNRRSRPPAKDFAGDGPGVFFFSIPEQDVGQLFVRQAVHQVGGGDAALAHPHVQRGLHVVGEPASRLVQLVRGDADVQQHAVHPVHPQRFQHLSHLGEICLHHDGGKALKPLAGLLDCIRIPVQGDQTAGGEPGGNRERMPAAARRAVQIHAVRPDVQRLYGLLQQYRPVVALFGPLLHAAAAFPCLLKSMRIPG